MILNRKGAIYFSESLALKIVSLLLALILWITILGFKREEVTKNVRFEPLVAPGMVITSKFPSYIQFKLSGPRVLLKDVDRRVQPIRPDLRRHKETVIPIAISEDLLGELPNGVKVVSYSPAILSLRLEEFIERKVSVKPTLQGNVATGQMVSKVEVDPPQITVAGPRSVIEELDSIPTEPFDTQDVHGTKEGVVAVEADASRGLRLPQLREVKVRIYTKRKTP